MSYGMVMSTLVGLIVTFIYPNDLAVTTVISIVISFILAVLIGMQFGLPGILESLGASFMGAMMGAMLAAMVPASRISFTLISMNLFFILFIGILLYYIRANSKKTAVFNFKKAAFGGSILLTATCLSLVTSAVIDKKPTPHQEEQPVHEHDHHH